MLIVPITSVFLYDFGTIPYQHDGGEGLLSTYGNAAGATAFIPVDSLLKNYTVDMFFQANGSGNNPDVLSASTNQPIVVSAIGTYNDGPIVTATLNAGGTGYVANDTGSIEDGSDDATYQVLTVGAGGAVLTFSVTSPGTEYTVENGVATARSGAQPGVGTGFKVNITAVQVGDGTVKVVTFYQVIPVP
jgi:hypothetical protein